MTEAELITKYKTCGIIKGSHRKGRGTHANKNVVDCKCRCGKMNKSVASSDLHLKLCSQCGEKLNRKTRKAVK